MSKLCHTEVNFKVKLPQSRSLTADEGFLGRNRHETQILKIRNQSDSSSAGVVQFKEKEGGVFVFKTWLVRGVERWEVSRW